MNVELVGELAGYVAVLAAGIPLIWLAAEGLGKALPSIPNVIIAGVLAVGFALALNHNGYLPNPAGSTVFWSDFLAVTMGLIQTLGAKAINDKANPLGKAGPEHRAAVKRSRLPK